MTDQRVNDSLFVQPVLPALLRLVGHEVVYRHFLCEQRFYDLSLCHFRRPSRRRLVRQHLIKVSPEPVISQLQICEDPVRAR
jgi:hypothetical protein